MLKIIDCTKPQPGAGETAITLIKHVHGVTITDTETGVTYEELSGPAEPLEGEIIVSMEKHRHLTTAGYLGGPA